MATEATASICSQLSSISIAPVPEENAAAVKEISKKKHEEYQKDIAAGDKKSWKNPKIEIVSPLEVAEEPYFEEPISSWPLPSSDGINKKKQTHRQVYYYFYLFALLSVSFLGFPFSDIFLLNLPLG